MNKQYLYVIDNNSRGAIIEFPASFVLPEKRKVKDKWFFKTDRIRRTKDYDAVIYTEKNCRLNLDEFAVSIDEIKNELKNPVVTTQEEAIVPRREHIPVQTRVEDNEDELDAMEDYRELLFASKATKDEKKALYKAFMKLFIRS